MRRKTVRLVVMLALVLLTAPLAAHAQPATKVYRIGRLSAGSPPSTPPAGLQAFQQGLRDLGYVEGQNLVMEYRTQLFIDNRGRIIGKHQKVQPTIGERLVHTGGFGDTMRAFETEFGPISGLICGENQNPLAVFTLAADSTVLHVSCWPHFFQKGWHTMPQVADLAGRALSYMAKCFVINACGTIDEEMRAVLPATDEDRAFLADPANLGGSSIISANSRVIAGPMGPEEGILYADIDVEVAVCSKLTHDFAGHDNRPDVFQLVLNTETPQLLRRTTKSGQASINEAYLTELPLNGAKGQASLAEAEHNSAGA